MRPRPELLAAFQALMEGLDATIRRNMARVWGLIIPELDSALGQVSALATQVAQLQAAAPPNPTVSL